ncbi:MBL fold metallo-hydrolase [candidate division KSB1 bacterium]
MKKVLVILTLIMLTISVSVFGQEVKTEKLTGNIYAVLTGSTVVVFKGDDGLLIVDTGFEQVQEQLKQEIKKITNDEAKFIINTHYHNDHTSGNKDLGKFATKIAHDKVKYYMSIERNLLGRTIPPDPVEFHPDVTFENDMSIHFNGEEIKLIHIPSSHTGGDIIVHFTKSNILCIGDLMFGTGRFPYIDLKYGGDIEGNIKSINMIISKFGEDMTVIPSHSDIIKVKDLKDYVKMLSETVEIVKNAIEQGKIPEKMKSENILKKYDSYGQGFVKTDSWIETVYESLTRK